MSRYPEVHPNVRELWNKAALQINPLKDASEWQAEFVRIFSELLVVECANICIHENVSNLDLQVMRESGKFTIQDLATKSCGENLAKKIKERFGYEQY